LDKKAGFYPVQCSLVDKTGKNIGAVSLTLHISIYYISGRNWATEKQKDIVFFEKNIEKYLTSPALNSTFANVIRNTTQKEKHKVLTKSKKERKIHYGVQAMV
jgi:hypothetical protein